MKVVFVLENYYPKIGGVETLFKSLVDELCHQGHEITVITNKSFDGKPIITKEEGVTLIRLPLINRYLFTFFACLPIMWFVRGKDVIHTTSYNAAFPAYFASFFMRKKIVITFHEVWGNLWFDLPFMNPVARLLHYLFERMILLFPFDRFIAVSNFTAERLALYGVKKERISMIYNGINYKDHKLAASNLEKAKKYNFSFFGRLGISKGLDVLLDAIEILKDDSSVHFNLIIPKHPKGFFKTIMQIIDSKGIAQNINLFHYLPEDELKEVLSMSHAVIVPSYSEGFCFSAVESIAYGIPVISSGKGALSEVISGNYIEFDPLNGTELAQAILKAKNGAWMHKEIKKFELNDKVNQYINLYTDLK